MPDGAAICPQCGADVEKIRAMLTPSYDSSPPHGQPLTSTSMAKDNSSKKWLIIMVLVAVGAGAFWYFRVQNAGFGIDKYKEMVSMAQRALPLLRQKLNAPAGDLVESFRGTPAGELLKVDQKFFQDLGPILSKGIADCAGASGNIESLKQQYQRTREPLAKRIALNQINPLLGLAVMQVFTDQMKATEPDLESFVASCPRESKALNFLLEKNK